MRLRAGTGADLGMPGGDGPYDDFGPTLERAGFRREGCTREAQWRDGAYRDGYLYAVLRTDPRPDRA